jgi:Recombination endonuclease VII
VVERKARRGPIDAVKAVQLYLEDESATCASIAEQLGCQRQAVARAVKNAGYALRTTTGNHRIDWDEAVRLYLEVPDRSAQEVARLMNISTAHATLILHKREVFDSTRVGARRSGNVCSVCREAEVYKNGKCKACRKDYVFWWNTKARFGVTREQWEKKFAEQEGRCAICGKDECELVVDHDHLTKKFRGLLCRSCNVAIGILGDNVDGVRRALKYLEEAELSE